MKLGALFLLCLIHSMAFGKGVDEILKICLTGSTEKAIPEYGEAFVNGAQMALDELQNQNIKLEVHYYESTPFAPLEKLKSIRKESCDAILGFSTGNDLLAIESEIAAKPVFTLSIYGDPQPRFEKTNYLRTMQPSADDLTQHLFEKLKPDIKQGDEILIVVAADRSEMRSYQNAFIAQLAKYKANLKIVNVVEQTQDFNEFNSVDVKKKKWSYVVLLTRSQMAAKLADELYKDGNTPIILGTKFFGSNELPAFLNFLTNKNVIAYFSRQNCTCDDSKQFQDFKKKYNKKFLKDPMSISADSYDGIKFISLSSNQKELSSISVINYLNRYEGVFQG